jgi:hypothetical protein
MSHLAQPQSWRSKRNTGALAVSHSARERLRRSIGQAQWGAQKVRSLLHSFDGADHNVTAMLILWGVGAPCPGTSTVTNRVLVVHGNDAKTFLGSIEGDPRASETWNREIETDLNAYIAKRDLRDRSIMNAA